MEEDQKLKSLDTFETKERSPEKKPIDIFELYRPMINGESVRARSEVSHEK